MFIQNEEQKLVIDIDQVRSFEALNEHEKFKIIFYFNYPSFKENSRPLYSAIWEFEQEAYRDSVFKEIKSKLLSQGKIGFV